MINVCVDKRGGKLTLTADGHAGFGQMGEDIVCAAVSMLSLSVLYALEGVEGIQLESDVRRGMLWLTCTDTPTTRNMMAVAEAGFRQLAEQYPKNVHFMA